MKVRDKKLIVLSMAPCPFSPGDILDLRSVFDFPHFGIFVQLLQQEDDAYLVSVIHVTGSAIGERASSEASQVREEQIWISSLFLMNIVANDYDNHWVTYSPDEIIQRARSKIGNWSFDPVENNAEHFATLCRYGRQISKQGSHNAESDGVTCVGLASGVNVGPVKANFMSGRVGVSKGDEKGLVLESTLAETEAGPVSAKLGLGVTTGVRNGNGTVGAQLLGTGFTVGRETSVSLFGSKLGFKLW